MPFAYETGGETYDVITVNELIVALQEKVAAQPDLGDGPLLLDGGDYGMLGESTPYVFGRETEDGSVPTLSIDILDI